MYHPPPCCQNSWQPHHRNNGGTLGIASAGLYGTLQGAEAAVHAACLFLDNLQPSEVILKLDFKIAFNTTRHEKMLNAVRSLVPELAPFIHSVYGKPSTLFWGQRTLSSREGVQQGDPLGPLLFCLMIHELCSRLESDLCLFYLDGGLGIWSAVQLAPSAFLASAAGTSGLVSQILPKHLRTGSTLCCQG